MARRFRGKDKAVWGPNADRVPASEAMWQQPYKWDRAAEKAGVRRRVFCASMADVFDDHPSIKPEWRERLWQTIRETPNLDWLLLTKRPEHFSRYLPSDWGDGYQNVWLGVSAENQLAADIRGCHLRETPAKIKFLSAEPLIDEIRHLPHCLNWVICGGETGPGARPMDLDWARLLRRKSVGNGVPFFFKSTGGRQKSDLLDGKEWKEFPA